mmetsp:Transcript_13409/g.38106  ORF Transcript_13409/g.38106 Transcript_13409/m.38106 type:complete len:298 (-) Transcript_13409:297-1190(-)
MREVFLAVHERAVDVLEVPPRHVVEGAAALEDQEEHALGGELGCDDGIRRRPLPGAVQPEHHGLTADHHARQGIRDLVDPVAQQSRGYLDLQCRVIQAVDVRVVVGGAGAPAPLDRGGKARREHGVHLPGRVRALEVEPGAARRQPGPAHRLRHGQPLPQQLPAADAPPGPHLPARLCAALLGPQPRGDGAVPLVLHAVVEEDPPSDPLQVYAEHVVHGGAPTLEHARLGQPQAAGQMGPRVAHRRGLRVDRPWQEAVAEAAPEEPPPLSVFAQGELPRLPALCFLELPPPGPALLP